MYKVKLSCVKGGATLRSPELEGEALELPTVEKTFMAYDDARYIRTSTVKEILESTDSTVVFRTMNSIYKIEYEKIGS